MIQTPDGRLVLAHGFTQTGESWNAVRDLLEHHGYSTTSPDLAGHGSASEVSADLWHSATQLVRTGGMATYVGYSMGGRIALHAALGHQRSVQRLVLIGATAGIEDDAERRERRASDERLAQRIETIGIAEFIDEWLATPLFAHLTAEQAMREMRLANTAEGLASSLRSAGTGGQESLWDRLHEVTQPTLLLVGEHDTKFTEIATRLHAALPDSRLQVIAGSGHSVHLEQPEATVDALVDWLRDTNA